MAALPCSTLLSLQRLDLSEQSIPHRSIARALEGLPQLQCVHLKEMEQVEAPCLPHLQRLCVRVQTEAEAEHLAAAVPHLTGLTRLTVDDNWSEVGEDDQLQLPGLQQLVALRELQCAGPVPPQVWYCTQLTALTCSDSFLDQDEAVPEGQDFQLGALQRLHLRNATAYFLPQLCSLRQLTSLLWVDAADTDDVEARTLPSSFSLLRWVLRYGCWRWAAGGLLLIGDTHSAACSCISCEPGGRRHLLEPVLRSAQHLPTSARAL